MEGNEMLRAGLSVYSLREVLQSDYTSTQRG